MSDRQYVRRPGRSWHIVRTHTRMFDGWIALCGRRIEMPDKDAVARLPSDKSCESCLRIARRASDNEAVS